jgi:hypothetical protein
VAEERAWDPTVGGSTAQADSQTTPRPGVAAVPSAARTTSGNSGALYAGPNANQVDILLLVTAASGTTPSMTVSVEWSVNGTTFAPAETPDAFTAVTTAISKAKQFAVKAPYFRIVWTITGTTPSFTFSADVSFLDD